MARRLFLPALCAAILIPLAGCSSPSATPEATAAPGTVPPLGAGSTARDQNLKNMPADARARIEAQGQQVK